MQSICDGGDAGTPVALNPDSITGAAFTQLAEEMVKAVKDSYEQAKRVRISRK